MPNIDEKCIHCGAYHDHRPEHCLAVKKVTYAIHDHVYGRELGVSSIEYVSLDEQSRLLDLNKNAVLPIEEVTDDH